MPILIRLTTFATILTFLTACGPSSPAPETSAGATVTSVDRSDDPLDVAEDRIMAQDQTEGTAEANPEVVNPAKLPEPKIVETTPETEPRQTPEPKASAKPVTPPAAPAKPAPKNTQTVSTTSPPPPPPAPAAAPKKEMDEQGTDSRPPDHGAFNSLLKTYVNAAGRVDYAGLKKNEAKLDSYLAVLAKDAPNDTWSRNEGLTYWLNAYNAYTLKLILKNYPVQKITDLHNGKPWDVKWIELDGKTYSLNQIEHDIIRPRYQDPRIHFAVVCAANSCPPLANYAFTASSVNSQLDKLARSFINNEKFNQTKGDVQVSKIFDWYAEDFGDVRAYLNKYLTTDIPEGAELGYTEYDWGLNKQ